MKKYYFHYLPPVFNPDPNLIANLVTSGSVAEALAPTAAWACGSPALSKRRLYNHGSTKNLACIHVASTSKWVCRERWNESEKEGCGGEGGGGGAEYAMLACTPMNLVIHVCLYTRMQVQCGRIDWKVINNAWISIILRVNRVLSDLSQREALLTLFFYPFKV